MGIGDVPVGSDAEFRRAAGLDDDLLPTANPAVDRAFQLMRGTDEERAKENKNKNKIVTLVSMSKSDEERGAELRACMRSALEEVCSVMTTARRENIVISYEISWDAAGRAVVQAVNTMKPL
jgi:hypothetical protein